MVVAPDLPRGQFIDFVLPGVGIAEPLGLVHSPRREGAPPKRKGDAGVVHDFTEVSGSDPRGEPSASQQAREKVRLLHAGAEQTGGRGSLRIEITGWNTSQSGQKLFQSRRADPHQAIPLGRCDPIVTEQIVVDRLGARHRAYPIHGIGQLRERPHIRTGSGKSTPRSVDGRLTRRRTRPAGVARTHGEPSPRSRDWEYRPCSPLEMTGDSYRMTRQVGAPLRAPGPRVCSLWVLRGGYAIASPGQVDEKRSRPVSLRHYHHGVRSKAIGGVVHREARFRGDPGYGSLGDGRSQGSGGSTPPLRRPRNWGTARAGRPGDDLPRARGLPEEVRRAGTERSQVRYAGL